MGTWLVPNKYFGKKNHCECFEEWNACLYVHSILKMPMSFLTLYKGNLQIYYETMNKSSWRSNKPLYVVRPWGRVLVKLRWPKALPTMLKPPTRFIIYLEECLLRVRTCKAFCFLKCLMWFFPYDTWWVSMRFINKQLIVSWLSPMEVELWTLPCMVSAKLNLKLSIVD